VKRKHIGSSFDSWLREEGLRETVTARVSKRVLAQQLEAAMKERNVTRTGMARRMRTSRAPLAGYLIPSGTQLPFSRSGMPRRRWGAGLVSN
jgi:hypothetical protein